MPDGEQPSEEIPRTDSLREELPDVHRPRMIDSSELFQGRREVWIEHGGEMYRLRVTSRNRLYLSK
ncbi:MAG: hemin uptake protein HemP [Pirellulales bacterium]